MNSGCVTSNVTRGAFCFQAEDEDVDLVLVNPEAEPPLVRVVKFSKYKFEMEKVNKDKKKVASK